MYLANKTVFKEHFKERWSPHSWLKILVWMVNFGNILLICHTFIRVSCPKSSGWPGLRSGLHWGSSVLHADRPPSWWAGGSLLPSPRTALPALGPSKWGPRVETTPHLFFDKSNTPNKCGQAQQISPHVPLQGAAVHLANLMACDPSAITSILKVWRW